MRLIHYSETPIGELHVIDQGRDSFKPRGLWVSDDDAEQNWRTWCQAENFGLERMARPHEVTLRPDANVLVLRSAFEIDAFTREWTDDMETHPLLARTWIAWWRVRERYAGLIITPYIWSRRLDGGANWYYGWDCASGCIWDPAAIASVRLLEAAEGQS